MKKITLLITILLLTTTLTGCSLTNFISSSKNTGGIFKSYDFGEKWAAANLTSEKKSLASTNVNVIKIDPQNHKNIYLGTTANGLWYSDNAGNNWRNILDKVNVLDIVLDHQNSGVVYVSLGKQVYKSINLGEKWESIYLEERQEIWINNLVIDPKNNLLLYISTSNGEVYKTEDGGESWQIILTAEKNDSIEKILINPKNTKIIYVGTAKKGIYRSADQGRSWINLIDNYYDTEDREQKKKYEDVEILRDLVFDLTQFDGLIYASSYGMLKSADGGSTWQDIQLLTPANSVVIRSLAIDPQDNKKIYYSTDTALYRTFDGGQTWLTSKLPSTRSASDLIIDYQTPNVMYMGMANLQK